MNSFWGDKVRSGRRRRARRPRLFGLAALVVLALVASIVAVVAVSGERRAPYVPFDIAGKRIDTELDPLEGMARPKNAQGVQLDAPDVPDDEVDGRPGVKPKKDCVDPDAAASPGTLAGELEGVDEVCTYGETRQSDDLISAPPLVLADGSESATKPKPEPGGEGAPTDQPSDDVSDAPTDAPTDRPSDEATDDAPDAPSDDASSGADGAPVEPTPAAGGSEDGARDDAAPRDGGARIAPAAARASPVGSGVLSSRATPALASRAAVPAGSYLSPNWVKATTPSSPPGTSQGIMVFDEKRNEVVHFGGLKTAGGYSNETWTWNGLAWTKRTPATSPSARFRAAAAWDPVSERVIMFGGDTGSTFLRDVWAWNGSTWAAVTTSGPNGLPDYRVNSAMAYDYQRQAMVVFGGRNVVGELNDTWKLANGVWTQIQANGAAGAPPARYAMGLAYSPSNSQLVMFGGIDDPCTANCLFGDTWTLGATASSWTQANPSHVPPARGAPSMTYHPGLQAVTMFGGINKDSGTAVVLNDTWAWTGSDWSQATGIAAPEGRAGAMLAATNAGQAVLFGGEKVTGQRFDETWTYDTGLPVLKIEVERASEAPTSDGIVWVGDALKVRITAANASTTTNIDDVSIVSALQSTILAAGTEFQGGSPSLLDKLATCGAGVTVLCGVVQDLNATIANVDLPVGGTTVGEFLATVAGSQKGCELVDIPAVASALTGGSAQVSTSVTVCGGGLGLEDWWTFDTTDLGGGGSASVNVANGNLVVKQYDTDPVQMPGRLALGLGRVYNSQDLMSGGGPLGAGWQFDLGDTGESAGGFGLFGLGLPNLQTVLQPLSMPYIDRDGTRHLFKLRSIGASVGGLSLPIDLTGQQNNAESILGLLNPATLPFALTSAVEGLTYGNLCVDQAYSGPPGSNMFLFRYVGMGANNCVTPAESGRLTIGWSLVRPDRVRYDFDAKGDLVRVTDPAGQQLVYDEFAAYGPQKIYTSSCTDKSAGSTCPKVTIDYDAGGAGNDRRVQVTDTAGRVTSYIVSRDATLPLLRQVWEPGNPYSTAAGATPTASYTYRTANKECDGSTATVTAGQLCSVTDANGATTTFGYVKAPVGPDRIAMVKDRRANATGGAANGLATKYTWSDPTDNPKGGVSLSVADMGSPDAVASCGSVCHRIRYSDIDRWGRVGQIAEGTSAGTDGTFYSQAGYLWDGRGDTGGIASCGQPTLAMNHNLCQVIRRAVPSNTAFVPGSVGTGTVSGIPVHDQAVDYLYGDLGQRLRQRVLLDASQPWTDANSAITTWGSNEQYFDAGNSRRVFNNHVRGNGVVKATAAGGSYRQAVNQDNPHAYWRLDESSGSTMASATATGNGYYGAGTKLGQPGVVHDNTAIGESNTGWGGVVTPLNGFAQGTTAGDSDFTVETWMKTPDTALEYAFQWGAGTAYASVGRLNGGFPFVALYSDSSANKGAFVYSTTPIADNQWHHVVFRYDGSGNAGGLQLWVDGEQAAKAVYLNTLDGPFASNGATAFVGASGGASSLDELAIYGSALDSSRIKAHHTAALGADRIKADTLYGVVDEVQELSPRGNAPANAETWGDYLTSTRRDIPADGVLASTNKPAGDSICGGAPRGNTGMVCEVDTPAAAGVARGAACSSPTAQLPASSPVAPTSSGYASSCTTYEYNTQGQRTLMRTPKANSEGRSDAFQYKYYPVVSSCAGADRAACDLSGRVSSGGWLKAVIDPAGKKLVHAYDAAGNIARTWDRNAADGKDLSAVWADAAAPPSKQFTDTVAANPVTSDGLSVSNTALVAVNPDGTVSGAGSNASGELGDGTTTARPAPVRADPMTNVVQVAQSSTGAYSGCAYTHYLTGDGKVWTAGGGTSVPKPVPSLSNIISIASGGCHFLALDAEGGLWGWGVNGNGQVGNGTTSYVTNPVKVLDKVATMGAGFVHSLAVTTDGKTYAWGLNNLGQLGLGDTTARSTPTQVAALDNAGIRQVSGGFAASYAVGRDGRVWAFGNNSQADLGDGTATMRPSPVQLTTLGPGTAAGPVRQVVGAAYGAVALMADGSVRVWGINNAGQSGGGASTATMASPVKVPELTGQVAVAGGWATIASADQAGRVKVWGATSNNQLANGTAPTTTAAPTLAGIDISPYKTALWGTQGSRDATGNLTTTTRDKLGQPRRTRTGRGHDINSSAYDRMVGYDPDGRTLWSSGAQHRSSSTVARTTYDMFGNPVKTVDARGVAFRATFDALNRQVTSESTRGPVADSPASCSGTATTAEWTAGQNGHMICTTSATYDGVGRQISATDPDSQVTELFYDAAGRQTRIDAPRNDGTYTKLSTRWNYDRDGRVLDVCPPRQFDAAHESDTTTGCAATGVHSLHARYDNAGNVSSQTTYRGSQALVTAYQYDADRNPTVVTDANGHATTASFDLQGRRLSRTVPRSSTKSYTTRWDYDASGNVTAIRAPGSINTGSGADGNLVVDGTTASASTDGIAHGVSNPFQVPDGAQYRNVTLQNGAVITSAVANGLMLHASGTVSVCSTCVVQMGGKGGAGGAAGTGANNGNGSDAANPNPGNGGKGGSGGLLGLSPSGGGGGGHKTDGGAPGTAGTAPGAPGKASGSPDFATVGTDYLKGSGGGGGGGGKNLLGTAGAGGNGGGYVRITANKIVVDGSIDASGNDGGAGASNSGGGGGGAGGGIWLAAPDVALSSANVLDVTGGAGGAGPTDRQGGSGSAGHVRIDADTVSNVPAGADRTRAAMVTAISYDAANRTIDTVEGAQTTQADPTVDASSFAVPDPNGLSNTRTRNVYDADGNIVAVLPPQAFSNAASLTAPSTSTARRIDHDLDGNGIASYVPRYDNSSGSTATSVGSGNDGGGSTDQQAAQCATGRFADQAAGPANQQSSGRGTLPAGYGNQVGVCVTRSSFDPVGNPARTWLPTSDGSDNAYLEYSYTGDMLTAAVTGPDPNSSGRVTVAQSRYDGSGRQTWTKDANGNISQTAYTADGLTRETTAQAYTSGGVTINEVTRNAYDAGGNLVRSTNPKGDVTSQVWTTDGLVSKITTPGSGSGPSITEYAFDAVGNPTQSWQPEAVAKNKRPVRNEFTHDNLLAATHTPITDTSYRSVRYAYSPAGLKTSTETGRCTSASHTDCDPGNASFLSAGVVKLTYGANGRPASQVGRDRDPLEGPSTSITTTYSQDGGPARVIDPTSGITVETGYYLDGAVRRVTESGSGTGGQGNTNTYAYNAAGSVSVRTDSTSASGVTDGAAVATSYRYNQAGLPAAMTSDVLDTTTSYTWDDGGRLTTAQTGSHYSEWSWHPNDAVAGAKTSANGTVVGEFTYTYDANRNVTKQTVTGTDGNYSNEYSYAPSQQLTGWTYASGGSSQTTTYGWDKNSNRTSVAVNKSGTTTTTTTSYLQDNSIASVDVSGGTAGDATYTYNRAGLLTNDGCSTYTYDAFDRIEKQVTANTTECGSEGRTTSYTYDGLDRQRAAAVTNASDANANGTVRNVYDGLSTNLVGQTSAVNGRLDEPDVLYQLDAGGAQMAYEQSGSGAGKAFLDEDGNGNIVSVTSTGHDLVCSARLDPFGGASDPAGGDGNGLCHNTGTAPEQTGNSIWFRGQARDGSTGNYQLGTRTYDPSTATFTTPDSHRVSSSETDLGVGTDPLTANTYSYVNGNPVNLIDSDGHRPACMDAESPCNAVPMANGTVKITPETADQKVSRAEATVNATVELKAQHEKEAVKLEKKIDAGMDWGAVFGGLIKDLTGLGDIEDCVKGSAWGCVNAVAGLIPWGKAWKLIKNGAKYVRKFVKATKAFKALGRDLDKVRGFLSKADGEIADARKALADARKARAAAKADEVTDSGKATRRGRDSGADDGPSCGLRSFGGETLVLMADGSRKPIRDVRVGDWVVATDPVTGEQVAKRVTHLWVHHDDLSELVLDVDADGDGLPDRLVTTEDHPFWNATDGVWAGPEELVAGDEVLTEQWDRVSVVGLDPGSVRRDLAYNLTVEGIHTYHVGASDVLVHNTDGCGSGAAGASGGKRGWEEAGIDPGDAARIQHTATQSRQRITVVGSRASGRAGPGSDWDYVLSGPSKARQSVRNSLPRGSKGGNEFSSGRQTGQDIFQDYNPEAPGFTELDDSLPHVIFEP